MTTEEKKLVNTNGLRYILPVAPISLSSVTSFNKFLNSIAELIANMEAPNDSKSDISNHSMIINEEASHTPEAEQEDSSAANETAAESLSTNNTSSRIGLLSLPPELRKMVYRHLLVEDYPLSTNWPFSNSLRFPAILDTCELIRGEAMHVMFAENTFFISSRHPKDSMLSDRQIHDTIQNVHFEALLNSTPRLTKKNFIHVLREFGSPAVVRGRLSILFRVGAAAQPPKNNLLLWFATHLPRFTNFRTMALEFAPNIGDLRAHDLCALLCDEHRCHLTPVFGPAESFADGRGVRFRPQTYLTSLPREADDWIDHLDGIRLDWISDLANADEDKNQSI